MSGSQVFDRLPATPGEGTPEDAVARSTVVGYFADRFGVPEATFDGYSLWEKGADKVWAFAGGGTFPGTDPVDVETLGMAVLRTGGEHWKPTTDAASRFGDAASRNVIDLAPPEARRFVAGEDQELDWEGDWGYLFAAHDLAGGRAVIGVGLYVHGELRSVVPKGRRRADLP